MTRMCRWTLPLLLALVTCPLAKAQEDEGIVSDRPDFTEASSTVGDGVKQLEGGYTYTQDETTDGYFTEHVFPEFLLRWGMTDVLELRLEWEGYVFARETDFATGTRDTQDGGTDMGVGFKRELTEACGLVPESALIASISLPVGAKAFSNEQVEGAVNYCYSWELNDWISLAGSTGLTTVHEAGDGFLETHQSFSLAYDLAERLGAYTEWYVILPSDAQENDAQNYVDGGFTWSVHENLQLDWRVGLGLNEASDDFFTGVGFVVRR